MKLINKTQRIYVSLVLVLMLVWSGAFLWAISGAIRENIDETLHSEVLSIVRHYQKEKSIETISSEQIEITPIPKIEDTTLTLSDTTLYNMVEKETFPYRQVAKQVRMGDDQAYQVILRRSMVEYDDLFEAILFMELIFMLLLLGGLFIINRKVLHRLWEPFYKTLRQLNNYQIAGDDQIEWPTTDVDEFNQLNGVLQKMMGRIENEYKQLKQFTENASHEIQTPLAVIQNQIEMLIQSESIPEGTWDRLQVISSKVAKLSRLNKALLLLTKIENDQYTHRETVNITDILDQLLREYKELASSKNITVKEQLEPDVTCLINRDLAEILFRNLLSNTVKHNDKDGHIEITLTQDYLIISNTGPELTKDLSLMFDRFQKGEDGSDSLGLGLAIVHSVVAANNFGIDYGYEKHIHTLKVDFNN